MTIKRFCAAMSLLFAFAFATQAHAAATVKASAQAITDNGQQLQSAGNPPRLEARASSSGPGYTGSAYAYADLTTGKVGSVTTNVYTDANGNASSQVPQNTAANGSFEDYLHFNIQGATASTLTTLGFDFSYDGAVAFAPYSGSLSFSALLEQFQDNSAAVTINRAYQYNNGVYRSLDDQLSTFGSTSVSEISTGLYRGTITLHGATPILRVFESIGTTGEADFSHTATFAFTSIPTGVTYTSDSGVFLSEVSAVPEPSACAMTFGGLVVIAFLLRRSRAIGT